MSEEVENKGYQLAMFWKWVVALWSFVFGIVMEAIIIFSMLGSYVSAYLPALLLCIAAIAYSGMWLGKTLSVAGTKWAVLFVLAISLMFGIFASIPLFMLFDSNGVIVYVFIGWTGHLLIWFGCLIQAYKEKEVEA